MSQQKSMKQIQSHLSLALVAVSALMTTACGKISDGNVTVQTAPLSGSGAASLGRSGSMLARLADGMMQDLSKLLLGVNEAFAAVSSFSTFKACNDTLIFLDGDGKKLTLNGTDAPTVGQGLLTFSPSSGMGIVLGSLNIPAKTTISEVDITFAVVPSVCGGATYAVQFDNGVGSGVINVTQNTAFKFKYPTPISISGDQAITLKFGAIVNAMVALGSGLNNSTIQTVAVQGAAE